VNDFEQTVLDGIEGLQTKQQEHLSDYSRFTKDTKKAFEELTKVKNTCNDLSTAVRAIERVRLEMSRERRMAFGDPLQRLLANEENVIRLNAAFRLALSKNGENYANPWVEKLGLSAKALGEDTSPGSTLINTELWKEIYDTLASFGAWATLGVQKMGTKLQNMPIRTVRAKAQFVLTEGGTIADDANKAGSSAQLEAEVIAVLLNVALQLIQDSEIDLTGDLMMEFTEAWNERLDAAVFNGDGTADGDQGGVTGVFNFGAAAVAGAGNTIVENLQLDDFVRCLTTVDVGVLGRQAKWWLHQQILARALLVRDANGRSIFLTALEAPSLGAIGSILGYPVQPAAAAPSTNAASKKVAAFGDPRGYAVGVRQDFIFEASDHHKWNTLQRSFRAWGRAGGKGKRATAFAILTTAAV
jgi:HK97 family phage major capsid protein